MRKHILFIFLLYALAAHSQSTWFKLYENQTTGANGFPSFSNLLSHNDTLYHVYTFFNFDANLDVAVDEISPSDGMLINSDSISYMERSNYLKSNQSSIIDEHGSLKVAINYLRNDTPKFDSHVFNYSKNKLATKDDFIFNPEKSIYFLKVINDKTYIFQEYVFDKNDKGDFNYIVNVMNKIDQDTLKPIFISPKSSSCAECHRIVFYDLLGNNQDVSSLFLLQFDNWDYAQDAQSFEAEILKLDTLGNVLWKCRPNDRDSFNTSYPTVVQKPDGNLIISWLDQWYKAYKSLPATPNAQVNDDMTLWFAEIEHETGKVLWRKNISQYLDMKMKRDIDGSPEYNYRNIYLKSAKLLADNTIVWLGDGTYAKDTFDWTSLGVLLKTDLEGNPIWYREYEMFPEDNGDKGLKFFSFIEAQDGGFILAGEYENRFGPLSGGTHLQRPTLLKVDSFGCYEPGCQNRGCTNPKAYNYDATATEDNGTCVLPLCDENYWQLELYTNQRLTKNWYGDDNFNIKIVGMEDGLTYFEKNTKEFARRIVPSLEDQRDTAYEDFYNLVCLPFTGQCYKVAFRDNNFSLNWKGKNQIMPMDFRLNFYHNKHIYYEKGIDDSEDDIVFYIKDGAFSSIPCIKGDSLPEPLEVAQFCTLFPNPAHDNLKIIFPKDTLASSWSIAMYNAEGKTLYNKEMSLGASTLFTQQEPFVLQTDHLANGIYVIHLNNIKTNHYETHKIIIEH